MGPRPCLERGCVRYAEAGSYCAEHDRPRSQAGWKKVREKALQKAGRRCWKCGITEQQAKANGTWLEVHHLDNRGIRAGVHDERELRVLCRPCHVLTFTKGSWAERKAELRARSGFHP